MFAKEDLIKAIRKGDSRLRVDNVIIQAGDIKIRGSGMLIITKEQLWIELAISPKSRLPEKNPSLWNQSNFWKVRGTIAHLFPFEATRVVPGTRTTSGSFTVLELRFRNVDLVEPRLSAKARRDFKRQVEALGITDWGKASRRSRTITQASSKHRPLAEFEAVLAETKLEGHTDGTAKTTKHPYLGKITASKSDTVICRCRTYTVALIEREGDVHIHFKSSLRYRSNSAVDDFRVFSSVLDAVSFLTGVSAWPYHLRQWRDGIKKREMYANGSGAAARV